MSPIITASFRRHFLICLSPITSCTCITPDEALIANLINVKPMFNIILYFCMNPKIKGIPKLLLLFSQRLVVWQKKCS